MRGREHGVEPLPAVLGIERQLRPSGRTPSIASRLRWKSSLVGLNTTKWSPAAGRAPHLVDVRGGAGEEGLSSVLKSARWGIAVPFG